MFGRRLRWENSSLESRYLTEKGSVEKGSKVVKVDNLNFASIVVGGKEYQRDILIFPDVASRKGKVILGCSATMLLPRWRLRN